MKRWWSRPCYTILAMNWPPILMARWLPQFLSPICHPRHVGSSSITASFKCITMPITLAKTATPVINTRITPGIRIAWIFATSMTRTALTPIILHYQLNSLSQWCGRSSLSRPALKMTVIVEICATKAYIPDAQLIDNEVN